MSLVEKDLKYIWHPFNHKGTEIVPIVKAEGAYIFGEDGKKYIDGFSSWWVNMHGHCHPYIAQKISEQALELEHVAFGGFTHPQAVKLAERLVKLLPENIDKIFFSDNGSTANEVALKMAIQYWFNQGEERNKFITFTNDYHGDTFGSMSLTARGGFNEPFERFLFDVEFVDTPNKENRSELLTRFETLLKSNDVAAFIFEPIVQGAAGMLMHSPEILSEMIELCQKYNVLTIADEVLTGFYRTGKFFSSDHLAFKPDIDDLRESPALAITEKLASLGYEITVVEPNISLLPEKLHANNIKLSKLSELKDLDESVQVTLVAHTWIVKVL